MARRGTRVVLGAVATIAALVGGSVAFALLTGPDGEPITPLAVSALVSHTSAGLAAVPAADQALSALVLSLARRGAEPTLGVTTAGTLVVTGVSGSDLARAWRSTDRGATWQDVVFPIERVDFDPYVHVDPATDRIFSVPLYKECSNVLWSDDEGASWTFTPTSALAGCPYFDHDHQSVTTGRPRGVSTNGYPNVVYYAYQSTNPAQPGAYVSRSLDGGSTWSFPGGVKAFDADCQGGLVGAPVAAPDGTLYLPKPGCDGIIVGVSDDSGETWRRASIAQAGIQGGSRALLEQTLQTAPLTPNPAVAVDESGVAYAVWTGADSLPRLAHSRDAGRTWSAPVVVTPPGVTSTVFTAAVAGAPGRLAIAYLGTSDDVGPGGAHTAPDATRWHLHVAVTSNASAEDPLFTTLRVDPDDDPAQIGCIWQGGGNPPCRNLRDYISITELDGRVLVAYADGCDRCASAAQSRGAAAKVVVLDGGPSLRDGLALAAYR